jgi:hypothetical protein
MDDLLTAGATGVSMACREEVRRARAGSDASFDLVAEVPPGADVRPWEAAGATWVLTSMAPQSPEPEVRVVVDAGP